VAQHGAMDEVNQADRTLGRREGERFASVDVSLGHLMTSRRIADSLSWD
jgi:hypothetical protein